MKILCFNWRDITHPMAGGAEAYFHEIAKRLADEHQVTLFCGKYRGCLQTEQIDGIRIIRRGGSFSLYLHAISSYLTSLRKESYDIVIDSINGVPFFTPLFIRKKKIAIIHHLVKRDIFFRELPFPLAFVGWFAERMIPLIYRKTEMITVSESSRQELISFGISDQRLHTIYNAIDKDGMGIGIKSEKPLIAYVGRIKQYKQLDHLLRAFETVGGEIPEVEMVIAGRGEYDELEKLATKLENSTHITMAGEVSREKKTEILKEAWTFVMPSMKEGWGVSVIEANSCGTPAIAYNVPGLRDSIRDGETGLLVPQGDIGQLSEAIIRLLTDAELRARLSQNALEWASAFSWDNSAAEFANVIEQVVTT